MIVADFRINYLLDETNVHFLSGIPLFNKEIVQIIYVPQSKYLCFERMSYLCNHKVKEVYIHG